MDILSIVGFCLAMVALIGGSILKGSGVAALWGPPTAHVIVIVGSPMTHSMVWGG
jgi:chemotaxis protein MotA